MSLPNNLGRLSAGLTADASLNIGVGVTPSGTYKFEVGTTSKFTGVATFGSTLSNGTYTYTLPSATGTLALTSALSGYLPLTGGTLTGALGGTSASFSSTLLATGTGSNTILGGTGLKVTSSNTGLYLNFSPSFTGGLEAEIASSENGLRIVAAGSGVNTMRFLTSNSSGVSTLALSINGTQAATFSSSVTATQFNAFNDRNYLARGSFRLTSSTNNASALDISVGDNTTYINGNYYGGGNDNTIIIGTYANLSNQLVLKPSGNVLIGTTTDAGYKLDVNGTGRFIGANTTNRGQLSIQSNNASNAARVTWYYDTTQQGEIGTTGGDFYALAVNNFLFYAGGSERMRLGSDGIFYYGTTTYNSALKGILFNPAGYSFFTIDGNTVAVGTAAININRLNNDGKLLSFQKNTSETGYISTNTYSLPSDFNFKKNINNLDLGLNLINKLRPVSYNHKIDDEGAALSTGFIAQEMEQSLTELGIEENAYFILQHKEIKDKTQSQYWMDYTKMIPVLVKAIQEQQQQIKELQSQINK